MTIVGLVAKTLVVQAKNDGFGGIFSCGCTEGSGRGAWGCLLLSPAAVETRSIFNARTVRRPAGVVRTVVAVIVVAEGTSEMAVVVVVASRVAT